MKMISSTIMMSAIGVTLMLDIKFCAPPRVIDTITSVVRLDLWLLTVRHRGDGRGSVSGRDFAVC
jgi:hypothetical protein